MRSTSMWTRREALQGVGSVAAVAMLPSGAAAFALVPHRPRFAYAGSMEDGGSIHTFAIDGQRWLRLQTVSSPRPSALLLHPMGGMLYVANKVDAWRGLACGSIESYSIHPADGRLTKIGEHPLSLSGTSPHALAIVPGGGHVVVAVYGGGAYNVLPIVADGSLGRVSGILKEIGAGPHPEHQQSAHPHSVISTGIDGYLFGTDTGCDRLNLLRITEGRLERVGQTTLQPGSGPGQIMLHPSGRFLFILNHLQASITTLACGAPQELLGVTTLSSTGQTPSSCSMILHPSGEFLYAAAHGGISTWRIHAQTGVLSAMPPVPILAGKYSVASISPDGSSLYALDEEGGALLRLPIHPNTGSPHSLELLGTVPHPRSLVIRYA